MIRLSHPRALLRCVVVGAPQVHSLAIKAPLVRRTESLRRTERKRKVLTQSQSQLLCGYPGALRADLHIQNDTRPLRVTGDRRVPRTQRSPALIPVYLQKTTLSTL